MWYYWVLITFWGCLWNIINSFLVILDVKAFWSQNSLIMLGNYTNCLLRLLITQVWAYSFACDGKYVPYNPTLFIPMHFIFYLKNWSIITEITLYRYEFYVSWQMSVLCHQHPNEDILSISITLENFLVSVCSQFSRGSHYTDVCTLRLLYIEIFIFWSLFLLTLTLNSD